MLVITCALTNTYHLGALQTTKRLSAITKNFRSWKSTNLLRGKHNVKKVELGEDVAKGAQEHAEKLKKDDKISKSDDSKRKKCWENTYKLPDGKDEFDLAQFDKDSVNMALKEWHDQVTLYNFKDGKE